MRKGHGPHLGEPQELVSLLQAGQKLRSVVCTCLEDSRVAQLSQSSSVLAISCHPIPTSRNRHILKSFLGFLTFSALTTEKTVRHD